MKQRAVGYIRVSTEEQVENHSLAAQRREIKRFCERKGYDLVRIYVDEGVSAHSDDIETRPEFLRMIEDAAADMFDVVIVHTLDRFARNVGAQTTAIKRLGEAKVGLASVTEDFDFTSPVGKFMLNTMGGVSELFSDLLAIHVVKGQRERAGDGLPVGPVPFGYEVKEPGSVPIPVPDKASAVRSVFERKVSGESNGRIANWLSQRFSTRTGRSFTSHSVRDMLKTRFYTGIITFRDEEFSGQHDPIIGDALFQRVQLIRGTRRGRRRTNRRPTGALQSLVSCINCGNPIHSERNNLGDPRYRERHGWQCPTNGRSTVAHRIDWQMVEIIAGIDLAPNWRSRITELVLADHPIAELKRLAEKRRRVARAYAEGAWSQPEFEARLSEIDSQLSAAEPVETPSLEAISELLDDFPMVWREATDAERQRLVAPLISRAFIDLDNKRISAIEPQPAFARLLETAITRTSRSACVLLTADEADRLANVGLVETGESRTRR